VRPWEIHEEADLSVRDVMRAVEQFELNGFSVAA
jgi:hypothetical protein